MITKHPNNQSFQVCVRLYKANQRVRDPELDNLLNIHEVVCNIQQTKVIGLRKSFQVKHWMDPQIIPYGWGLFSEGEEVMASMDMSHHIV